MLQQAFDFGKPRTGRSACPPRRNIVIEAGAGTGKTTAIVAEVLKLLLGDETLNPERIVLVILGALFNHWGVMAPVLWVLAVLSTITVVHRIQYTYANTKHLAPLSS